MREDANVRLTRGLYDAFSGGDIGVVLNFLAPRADLIFEGPTAIPWAGNWHGRDRAPR